MHGHGEIINTMIVWHAPHHHQPPRTPHVHTKPHTEVRVVGAPNKEKRVDRTDSSPYPVDIAAWSSSDSNAGPASPPPSFRLLFLLLLLLLLSSAGSAMRCGIFRGLGLPRDAATRAAVLGSAVGPARAFWSLNFGFRERFLAIDMIWEGVD